MFIRFRTFIHQNYGIFYADGKNELLKLKIDKCLFKAGVNSYDDYFELISFKKNEIFLSHFLDEITVNKTHFFREIDHFNFIKANKDFILKNNATINTQNEIKCWSMACSTGQEAYTLAMILKETFSEHTKIKILATDISKRVLKTAALGIYPKDINKEIDNTYLEKYFMELPDGYGISNGLKNLVNFRQFNITQAFPFTGKFDLIFCRNVLIYFNVETQQKIIDNIYEYLNIGGLLFVGQCESLINKKHSFKHVSSSLYMK